MYTYRYLYLYIYISIYLYNDIDIDIRYTLCNVAGSVAERARAPRMMEGGKCSRFVPGISSTAVASRRLHRQKGGRCICWAWGICSLFYSGRMMEGGSRSRFVPGVRSTAVAWRKLNTQTGVRCVY